MERCQIVLPSEFFLSLSLRIHVTVWWTVVTFSDFHLWSFHLPQFFSIWLTFSNLRNFELLLDVVRFRGLLYSSIFHGRHKVVDDTIIINKSYSPSYNFHCLITLVLMTKLKEEREIIIWKGDISNACIFLQMRGIFIDFPQDLG